VPGATAAELIWLPFRGRPEQRLVEEHGVTLELYRGATAIHEPLLRRPLVTDERVLVASSEGDRITPPDGARRLAAHFRATEVVLPGSHILHFLRVGRRAVFEAAFARMAGVGL